MSSPALNRAARYGVSVSIAWAVVTGATHLRHVNHTTVALGLVLVTLGLAMQWGWIEALAASLAGGLAFDYYLLTPRGFGVESSEHLITLLAFLLTASTTGWLAARVSRRRSEAEQCATELGRLYELVSALRDNENIDTMLERITDYVVEIFEVEGAAFFDPLVGRVFRSGGGAGRIPEARLRATSSTGIPFLDRGADVSVVAIRENGNLAGSLGTAGFPLSQRMRDAVAERVGVAIAKAHATRHSMETELVRRSENLKSAVLDALAHEIEGPLATVKISVSTLLSQHPGNAVRQRELLDIIDEEVDRMKQWIDDAVSVSAREASEVRLQEAPSRTMATGFHA